VSSSTDWQWDDVRLVTGDDWMAGGEWQPTGCVARYHMAVIIPCRDRDSHLKALLRHLIPLLRRQFVHFRVFVVEQVTRTVPTCDSPIVVVVEATAIAVIIILKTALIRLFIVNSVCLFVSIVS